MPSVPRPRIPLYLVQYLFRHSRRADPQVPRLRRFVSLETSLLLVRSHLSRPQLPFLHASSRFTARGTLLNRLISTEANATWRENVRKTVRFQLYFWPFCLIAFVFNLGAHQTYLERNYQTPEEWTLWSRWAFRDAKEIEKSPQEHFENFWADWGRFGDKLLYVLSRLEDPNIDGGGIREPPEGETLITGVGRTGFDVSEKSEPWRRCYHAALMGAAKAAERLDGWVRDRTRNVCFPSDAVVGPSNPRPKPVPYGKPAAPQEEDCGPAFAGPEVYYMKVLTTTGFTTGQRLDAALAYADWLEFKGLTSTALDMYSWALSIAASGIPPSNDSSSIIDLQTGVLKPGSEHQVTANLLRASTALAVHNAKKGDLNSALSIFLSVLRVRRSLSTDPNVLNPPKRRDLNNAAQNLKAIIIPWPFPPAPPSGDEPPLRSLPEVCEEAGVMAYIGEILFAASSADTGLGWTRDAVEKAEEVLWVMRDNNFELGKDGERCQECLEVSLGNWTEMVRKMIKIAEEREQKEEKRQGARNGWRSWLPWVSENKEEKHEVAKWSNEAREVDLVARKVRPLLFDRISIVT